MYFDSKMGRQKSLGEGGAYKSIEEIMVQEPWGKINE